MLRYIGQQFGDYRLVEYLGSGTFADVYLGEHIYLGIKAAVKVLKGIFTAAEIETFRKEAQMIAHLEHPNIVPLITFSVANIYGQKIPFLVLHYAPNGSLDKLHPRGTKLPITTIVSYIKQMADALQYTHNKKVVHRDIKPANFLLGNKEQVLLSDFGIAVISHRTISWEGQSIAGTWAYMAPEQFQAKAEPASDQYSLGIVVYQWLCGELPFTGDMYVLPFQQMTVPPPPLHEKITISPAIEQVVLKALAKDPKQRFEHVQAFANALEQACGATQSVMIASSAGKEVMLACELGKDFMPVTGENQTAYVLLEAIPTELMAQVRMPLNFALVIDNSSSMKGAKLKNVKEALKMVIDQIEPTDFISVVIFDDTCQVVIPSMAANDKPGMKAAISRINVRHTNGRMRRFMSLGMIQGLNELRRWNIPNAVNRMILLTDGVNYGDSDRCRQLARDARSAGITIYPLGIGSDWDERLLDDVGELSGGPPAEFIRNPEDALTLFAQQFQSAVAVDVCNATLTLRLSAGVTPKKAVKVLPIISDLGPSVLSERQVVIPLGDLEKDTPQSVLIELMIDPHPAGLFHIAQAELTYDVPIAGTTGESERADIKVTFTTDAYQAAQVNPIVMHFAEKANSASPITQPLPHSI
jgi:Ca-activated chloride channel family protein